MKIEPLKLAPLHKPIDHYPSCRPRKRGKWRRIIVKDSDWSRTAECSRCHASAIRWFATPDRAGYEIPPAALQLHENPFISHNYS